MTISSEVCAVTYSGNGASTHWVFNFLVPADSAGHAEVFVVVTDISGAVTFIDPSQYSITGVGNPTGGAVDYPVLGIPLLTGETITIIRGQPYTQEIPVSNQAFFPHTLEGLADLLTMQTQQLNEKQTRALTAPPGEAVHYIPSLNLRKNKLLGFDSSGQPTTYSVGGGGGGSSDWNDLTNVPVLIEAIDGLAPGAGKIIEFTSGSTAHLINTPSGTVSSVNGDIGAVVLDYADVGAAPLVHTHLWPQVSNFGDGVAACLAPGTNVTFSFGAGVITINSTAAGGSMQPQLMSVFAAIDGGGVNTANNDTAITAAEADAQSSFYWPDGVYATTKNGLAGDITKGYVGRGITLFGTTALPARFSYALVKPTTWPTQGLTGWFRGDQKFTDAGQYKVIGPAVRKFDLTARYYESNLIPSHRWFDNLSGSSGCQALLTVGAAAGAFTVTVPGGGDASWVGKTAALSNSFGGSVVETKIVAGVSGTTVTFTTALANTYVWNPNGGLSPNIFFTPRTWGGDTYVKVKAAGGGDTYGHIVRTSMEYTPLTSELAHTFMAGTVGQYGGDVNFIAGSSGTYATSLEFAAYDQNNDVAYIGEVYSFLRNNDIAGANVAIGGKAAAGRIWLGGRYQSAGTKNVDVGTSYAGKFRWGLDFSLAALTDTTIMRDPAIAGAGQIATYNIAGAKPGDPISITDGVNTYNGTVLTVVGAPNPTIFFTPGLNFAYAAGSQVTFSKGGGIISAALGQRIVWNNTALSDQNGNYVPRGAGAAGLFGAIYGNVTGDIETGTDHDGSGDFWFTRFNGTGHSNATARIRLYPTDFRANVKIQSGATIEAAQEIVSDGFTADVNISGAFIAGAGSGNMLRFNSPLNRWELLKGNVIVATW